jgi:hypothetical protein
MARSGFPWEKTTKRPLASVYTNCETAVGAGLSELRGRMGMLPKGDAAVCKDHNPRDHRIDIVPKCVPGTADAAQ